MTHRYTVQYSASPLYEYALLDIEKRRYVFGSDRKSEVIAKAQLLNGFTPVDGDERTYVKQIRLSNANNL